MYNASPYHDPTELNEI